MICGDGPAREDLENQVKRLHLTGSVIFTGEISNDQVHIIIIWPICSFKTSVSESQGLTYNEPSLQDLKLLQPIVHIQMSCWIKFVWKDIFNC